MWKIQEIITEGASHSTCWVTRVDSQLNSRNAEQLHWAKLYTGSRDWPEFEYFCRQASLGSLANITGIVPLTESNLDSSSQQPLLVYPKLDACTMEQWLLECSQLPARSVLVWLMRQTVEALSSIHQAGMVHGQVEPKHVLVVRSNHSVQVVGLGALEIIGEISSLPRHASRFDAPERLADEFEVSTAADVYSAGVIMAELLGNSAEKSPVVRAMLASDPNQRPTASEVAGLLLELERKMFGETISCSSCKSQMYRAA